MDETLTIGDRSIDMREFIFGVFDKPQKDEELAANRSVFMTAGVKALKAALSQRWLHYGLEEPKKDVYARLAELARTLLESKRVTEFFFIHKPPGLRIRFLSAPGESEMVRSLVNEQLAQWRNEGLISKAVPGVYEPENVLFGGPDSMEHAQRLFTIDSLTWLDFHSNATLETPSWAFSLLMIRPLLNGLEIIGWEDRNVWTWVHDIGKRKFTEIESKQSFGKFSDELRRYWSKLETLSEQISPSAQELLDKYTEEAMAATRKWQSEYFHTEKAIIGPSEAIAFFIILHWNRARLTIGAQALITEALVARPQYAGAPDAQ